MMRPTRYPGFGKPPERQPVSPAVGAVAAPHACPVRITLSAQEIEALYRGDDRTFVTIVGTNNCGQAIQVEVRRRSTSEAMGDDSAPYSELPPFSEYNPEE